MDGVTSTRGGTSRVDANDTPRTRAFGARAPDAEPLRNSPLKLDTFERGSTDAPDCPDDRTDRHDGPVRRQALRAGRLCPHADGRLRWLCRDADGRLRRLCPGLPGRRGAGVRRRGARVRVVWPRTDGRDPAVVRACSGPAGPGTRPGPAGVSAGPDTVAL